MKNYLITAIIAISNMAFFSTASIAQCNSSTFIKKKCIPNIQPFTQSGQIATNKLSSGQKTELKLTFSSGQDYRILICSEELLGDVSFRVRDVVGKIIFDSKDNDYPDFWDFKVKSTQQFIVEVFVPQSDSPSSIPPSGCVSIIVGFKKSL
ncbi:MAG: hypothetical protein ACT4ON_11630 [Bacteroidota bacterium]